MLNVRSDLDDFGNKLSLPNWEKYKNAWVLKKEKTADIWQKVAKVAHDTPFLNLNPTPEQARYVADKILSSLAVNVIDSLAKDLKAGETRTGKFLQAVFGTKTAFRPNSGIEQKAFIRVQNSLRRYHELVDVITSANERYGENGKKELSFSLKSGNLYTWLEEQKNSGNYSDKEFAVLSTIAEYMKVQNRTSAKKMDKANKHKAYHENNVDYLDKIRKIEEVQ